MRAVTSFCKVKYFMLGSNSNLLSLCALFEFTGGSADKESTCNVGDLGLIPGLGRSPGEGKGYPLQHSCLENSMDCIVLGVPKSWKWLSNFHFQTLSYRYWAMSFLSIVFHGCVVLRCFSRVWLFATPWTAAHQAPPSMGFSRQECWSGVPLPSPTISWSLLKFMSTQSLMLSTATPLSSCPQSDPASGFFPVSWLFASSGQILEFQLQHQSFQWIFRVDFL